MAVVQKDIEPVWRVVVSHSVNDKYRTTTLVFAAASEAAAREHAAQLCSRDGFKWPKLVKVERYAD